MPKKNNNFGNTLRKIRKDRGMSLRDVEKITKISNGYLSQIETGAREIPRTSTLTKLAQGYGIPTEQMYQLTSALQPPNIIDLSEHYAPELDFIISRYKKLSEKGKNELKDFLAFLLDKEKGRK